MPFAFVFGALVLTSHLNKDLDASDVPVFKLKCISITAHTWLILCSDAVKMVFQLFKM